MIRILGIDCGSAATGYGLIDTAGQTCRFLSSGVIRTASSLAFPERLKQIAEALAKVVQTYAPDEVAVEGIFHSVNARSALLLGQVRGVALLIAAQAGLAVVEYSPLEVKSSVVGYGRAEKSQVQQMVKVLLGLEQCPAEDAADALAVALCHAHHTESQRRHAQLAPRGRSAARTRPLAGL